MEGAEKPRRPESKKTCKYNPTGKHSYTTFERVGSKVGKMLCSWCGRIR